MNELKEEEKEEEDTDGPGRRRLGEQREWMRSDGEREHNRREITSAPVFFPKKMF